MVREEFNLPVVVAETCKDCNSLFKNCTHFNMPVELQAGITNCNSMFMHCRNFNQPFDDCDYHKDPDIMPGRLGGEFTNHF